MRETSARLFYNLLVEMNVWFQKPNTPAMLVSSGLADDFSHLISRVVNLSKDAQDEVFRSNFNNEQRSIDLARRIEEAEREIINSLSRRGQGNTIGPITGEIVQERLLSVAEQVENSGLSGSTATREQMISETEALISEVRAWELDSYAKQTLLIQLNHIARVIQAADTYSSADLRRRVKIIIADFAAEFSEMDKEHQTQLERLLLWARRGFFAGTIFLGLTADVTSISGALPPPMKLIGKD